MSRSRRKGGTKTTPLAMAGLALDLLGLIERFAGGYVGWSVGAIVGDAEAAVGVGRTGPGGASPGGATSFQIGSVTKVFTSLLLADAVQRGDVALDQRLDSIYPGTATHPDGRPAPWWIWQRTLQGFLDCHRGCGVRRCENGRIPTPN